MSGWFWWIASKTFPLYNELIFLNAVITLNFNLQVTLVISFVTSWIWLKYFQLIDINWVVRQTKHFFFQNFVFRNVLFICISSAWKWASYTSSGACKSYLFQNTRFHTKRKYALGKILWVNDSSSFLKLHSLGKDGIVEEEIRNGKIRISFSLASWLK